MKQAKEMKIVVLDGYTANPGDLSWDEFRTLGDVVVYDRTLPGQVVERAAEAVALLTNKVLLTAEIMDQLPSLRYIGVLATGYNVVDLAAAGRKGIVVTNIPAYSTNSVAQLTFAHILNVVNRVGHYADLNRAGKWSGSADFCYWDTPLMELAGKSLGIVGLGSIGMRVAMIALQFGMNVLALTSKEQAGLPKGMQKVTFEQLLAQSDILSLHCPLTAETKNMINEATIARMKRGAVIVNTGRGPLVDERAVADALAEGRLAAYAADVLSEEPPRADNPLLTMPNAFVTPHIGWATREARMRLLQTAAQNLRAFLDGHPVNVVG